MKFEWQFQCHSMKNYQTQTPQNLALTKILQNFSKTSTSQRGIPTRKRGTPTYYLAKNLSKTAQNEENYTVGGTSPKFYYVDPPLVRHFFLTIDDSIQKHTTGRARLIRSHSLARFSFELSGNSITVKFTSNWWNFELTVFELTVHFKHEIIGIWQRFQRNFELSGTSN